MPVPVPTTSKCPSYPINKPTIDPRLKQSALQHLLNSLPEHPARYPETLVPPVPRMHPLLPSGRYSAAASDNAAQFGAVHSPPHFYDSRRAMFLTTTRHAPLSNGKPWPPTPPSGGAIEPDVHRRSLLVKPFNFTCNAIDNESEEWTEDEEFFPGPTIQRPPIKTSNTEGNLGPTFPSLAPAADTNVVMYRDESSLQYPDVVEDGHGFSGSVSNVMQSTAPPVTEHKKIRKALSPVPTIVAPNDMALYRKLVADPLSEWVAQYIWKVVTHGMSLPPEFVTQENGALPRVYASEPPKYLADSIRTLFCATLLQPSAIFLALWYLARFPIFFSASIFDPISHRKEFMFRLELLGEGSEEPGADKNRQLLEAHAPFRLVLLGVMLANKWLDDNTFSNKTWHQVSGVPMRALNKLESLALNLLSHDLSLLPQAWAQWLDHLQAYHRSLAPYPEPIGPPRETPHAIIRRTIEELLKVRLPPITTGVISAPVFLGLAEYKQERDRMSKEQIAIINVDLDEDGPLRAEYLPRRQAAATQIPKWHNDGSSKNLPPPAVWSPAADPPIHRFRPVYQAVQGPSTTQTQYYTGLRPDGITSSMSINENHSLPYTGVHLCNDCHERNAVIQPGAPHIAIVAYQDIPLYFPNALHHCASMPQSHPYHTEKLLPNNIVVSQPAGMAWLRT